MIGHRRVCGSLQHDSGLVFLQDLYKVFKQSENVIKKSNLRDGAVSIPNIIKTLQKFYSYILLSNIYISYLSTTWLVLAFIYFYTFSDV